MPLTSGYLVYCGIGNIEYVRLLDLMLRSLYGSGYDQDVAIFLGNEGLRREVAGLEVLKGRKVVIVDPVVDDKARACLNKLRISELGDVQKYEKVLYLDLDILVIKDVTPVFGAVGDKLSFSNENPTGLMSHFFWGGDLFNEPERAAIEKDQALGLNSGLFGFVPSSENLASIGEAYSNLLRDISTNEHLQVLEGFVADQPMLNYVLRKNRRYDYNLQPFVAHNGPKLDLEWLDQAESKRPALGKDVTFLHFCGSVGNFRDKYARMRVVSDRLFNHRVGMFEGDRDVDARSNARPSGPVETLQFEWEMRSLLGEYQKMGANRVLEIGSHEGGSLYHWINHAAPGKTGDGFDGKVVSVDVEPRNEALWRSWADKRGVSLSVVKGKSGDHETMASVLREFGPGPLDFLFIDGDHSYEGVKKDFETYGPLVRPGGIIALHDILRNPRWTWGPTAYKLWDEIRLAGYKTREVISFKGQDECGIGIIYVEERREPMVFNDPITVVSAEGLTSFVLPASASEMARDACREGYRYAPEGLRVKYVHGARTHEDAVPAGSLFVPRPFVDGFPDQSSGFVIHSAMYGANKWVDVTSMVADKLKSPFEHGTITDNKGGWPCGDPDPNVHKHLAVKFSYGGKSYVKSIRDPDTHIKLLDPTFSVIIPTWNRAKLLPRCVHSVLDQDFDPNLMEVIVVDDGSTDDTPRVMAVLMADNRVRYARLAHTGCPGLARNYGIGLSTGRIISLLDTDDKYKPNHLKVLDERFSKADCMIARVLYDFVMINVAEDGDITEHPEMDFSKQLWNIWGLYPSCWSFRRELLSKIQQPPFPTRRSGDDTFFWWEAVKFERARGRVAEHPEEVIEDSTVVYGLISKGNNLSYELMPESQVFRDKKL